MSNEALKNGIWIDPPPDHTPRFTKMKNNFFNTFFEILPKNFANLLKNAPKMGRNGVTMKFYSSIVGFLVLFSQLLVCFPRFRLL
jgi:hypothetical protein